MKKAITASAILFAALIAYATMTGDLNTWLGYMAGEDASGNRTTVQGAGAGGGAGDLLRTELIGAASGVYGYGIYDTVGIGYRALRHSTGMTNVVAIGAHALEGVGAMERMANATWINGHFVANPPNPDPTMGWSQVPGEFYITGDASKTNALAPIWYDGSTLWLNADSVRTSSGSVFGSNAAASLYDGFVGTGISIDSYHYHPPRWTVDGTEGKALAYISEVEAAAAAATNYTDAAIAAIGFRSGVLAGKTFDLSTDTGLREAVSNIVITLGGTVVN